MWTGGSGSTRRGRGPVTRCRIDRRAPTNSAQDLLVVCRLTGVLKRARTGVGVPAREAGRAAVGLDTPLAARALGLLYLAGATIGLGSLLLPHPPRADLPGLYSNVALAYVGATALLFGLSRVRPWMLHVAVVAGGLLITRAVLLSADAVSFYAVWYIWIGLYVFYFCSRPAAAAHVVFVAVLYAGTLANDPPSSPMARWITTVATLVVAGTLIDALVRRARHEAATSAATAASLAQVAQIAHQLAGISESGPARTALCDGAVRVGRAERATLWQPSAEGTGLRVSANAGLEPDLREVAFAGPATSVTHAFACAETVTSATSPELGVAARAAAGDRFTVWCPVVRDRRSVAVLELSWSGRITGAGSTLISLAGLLATETAVTLERIALLEELEAVARTDELTGLPNRRAWQEQLARELARAQRSGESLAVAMLDLDHFKDYNDSFGHQTGDRLLKEVAGAWSAELRASDLLARYGGEEFGLALPARDTEDALAAVERLRAVMPDGQSCSAGLAVWSGDESASDLVDRADHALYRAKRGGRNRTAVASAQAPAVAWR